MEATTIKNDEKNLLEMKNINKEFPGVKALKNVDFVVKEGEVHGVVGENGAGKSTLIKILHGIYIADSGDVIFNGNLVTIHTTSSAHDLGIECIHQIPRFVEYLSVGETVFAGVEPTRGFLKFVDWNKVQERSKEIFHSLDIDIDYRELIRNLNVPQRQMIAIGRAMVRDAKMIVFDEPTASLGEHEVKKLFETIRKLRKQGVTVIYITHRLEEIFEICDRVTVFRNGKNISTKKPSELTMNELVKLMTGLEKGKRYPKKLNKHDEVILSVKNLNKGQKVKNISFDLHTGEILGLAGLVGAGRTEIVRIIFGADKRDSGEILLNGKAINFSSPYEAIKNGIVLVPENRGTEGIVKKLDVKDNIILPSIENFCSANFIKAKEIKQISTQMVQKLSIVTPSINQRAENLSGGNQQKLVLAKWLVSEGKVFLLDEPTMGVDVGAKVEIFKLINQLAKEGKGVVLISTALEEIAGMCDRILIIRSGEIVEELVEKQTEDVEKILTIVKGGK